MGPLIYNSSVIKILDKIK